MRFCLSAIPWNANVRCGFSWIVSFVVQVFSRCNCFAADAVCVRFLLSILSLSVGGICATSPFVSSLHANEIASNKMLWAYSTAIYYVAMAIRLLSHFCQRVKCKTQTERNQTIIHRVRCNTHIVSPSRLGFFLSSSLSQLFNFIHIIVIIIISFYRQRDGIHYVLLFCARFKLHRKQCLWNGATASDSGRIRWIPIFHFSRPIFFIRFLPLCFFFLTLETAMFILVPKSRYLSTRANYFTPKKNTSTISQRRCRIMPFRFCNSTQILPLGTMRIPYANLFETEKQQFFPLTTEVDDESERWNESKSIWRVYLNE